MSDMDLSKVFGAPMPRRVKATPDGKHFAIRIDVTTPRILTKDGARRATITLTPDPAETSTVTLGPRDQHAWPEAARPFEGPVHAWAPVSEAIDFEVTDKGKIARGQCIGIILIECLYLYVQVIHDRDSECGYTVRTWTWDRTDSKAEDVLRSDLGIGYEVLVVQGHLGGSTLSLVDDGVRKRARADRDKSVLFFIPQSEAYLDRYRHWDDTDDDGDDARNHDDEYDNKSPDTEGEGDDDNGDAAKLCAPQVDNDESCDTEVEDDHDDSDAQTPTRRHASGPTIESL
ncbi:hypothetical protein pmac_cds_515 [Pandoravirus macleodensis]|uniref:Uncharacterized protein n=1 Tax=Pandoravirus macleodensis TaxID=2107707 RepID=A0A2U7UFG0_9VIRU|nr:hypothetical protein pmac_cds_515 [Pandoravirus macleodensis]AVK77203.1 hypothetical protein pmac_cds_515 [Pandoravirus macleodensis]